MKTECIQYIAHGYICMISKKKVSLLEYIKYLLQISHTMPAPVITIRTVEISLYLQSKWVLKISLYRNSLQAMRLKTLASIVDLFCFLNHYLLVTVIFGLPPVGTSNLALRICSFTRHFAATKINFAHLPQCKNQNGAKSTKYVTVQCGPMTHL